MDSHQIDQETPLPAVHYLDEESLADSPFCV